MQLNIRDQTKLSGFVFLIRIPWFEKKNQTEQTVNRKITGFRAAHAENKSKMWPRLNKSPKRKGKIKVQRETSPKGFLASKYDVGNWIFSKSFFFWNCFWNILEFFLNFLLIFFAIFLEDFFGGIFWEKFFGRIFWEDLFGRIFGMNYLGQILCLYWNWLVCQDFGFCQDFVSMEKEGRGQEFRSLEVREASSLQLKRKWKSKQKRQNKSPREKGNKSPNKDWKRKWM